MARLNPNIPSPLKQPTNSKPSSSYQPATVPNPSNQPSPSFEKFLSKVKNVDTAPRPARASPSTSTQESPDFSTFSINKSVQAVNTLLTRQTTPRGALRDTAGISVAGGRNGKRAIGYSNWDISKPRIDEPAQKVSEISTQGRQSRIRSCESVDEELEGRTRHDVVAVEPLPKPVADTEVLDNGDIDFLSSRVNATTTTLDGSAPSPHHDTVAHASHQAKVHTCLEIHSLLLARLNALPLADPDTAASDEIALSAKESKKLHRHLSRCEQNLHLLLREDTSNEKSTSLKEACVDILGLVTSRILAIETGNADEGVVGKKEAVGGKRIATESWVMSEDRDVIGTEEIGDEEEGDEMEKKTKMKKKRRRQHRGEKRRAKEGGVRVNSLTHTGHSVREADSRL